MNLDLFGHIEPGEAFARSTDPEPSHEAAHAIDANALQGIVLEALAHFADGATTEQLAEWTGLSLVTISPRMKPLERKQLVERGGKRANRSGVSATVWRAK